MTCPKCGGYGHHHRNDSLTADEVRPVHPELICKTCDGTGQTPPAATELAGMSVRRLCDMVMPTSPEACAALDELERRCSPPAATGTDEAWERMCRAWSKTTDLISNSDQPRKNDTGFAAMKAELGRILAELRPSPEAVAAAERVLEAHKFHEPRDCNFLVVARELVRLAGTARPGE